MRSKRSIRTFIAKSPQAKESQGTVGKASEKKTTVSTAEASIDANPTAIHQRVWRRRLKTAMSRSWLLKNAQHDAKAMLLSIKL